MPSPKHRKTFPQRLKADHESSRNTVDILRSLSRSTDALEDARHGPRTTGERLWLGLCRFLRRELGYIGMEVRKLLLILVFNFVAVFMFFWLLSLI